MRLEQQRLIEHGLASNERCIGAVFCTYTFDPAFFEESVLRAILLLDSDPTEDAARFHEEARAALQCVPVACIIDDSVRQGGRRLPYDVHLVRQRTYHPKVYVVLYESEARVAVGSGNLTRSGVEQNTELFFVRALRYDAPADAAILREIRAFILHSRDLSHTTGTQLDLVVRSLDNRLLREGDDATELASDVLFVSSANKSMLDHLREALPERATITRVGVLAPFFESDDVNAGDQSEGLQSVIADIAALRPSKTLAIDIAVPWDDPAVVAPEHAATIDAAPDCLWAWRKIADDKSEYVEYLSIGEIRSQRVRAVDAHGSGIYLDRDVIAEARRSGSLWPLARPKVFAPSRILRALAKRHELQLWLHPTTQLAPMLRRRPLHAKLVAITTNERGRARTYVLLGSANASRAALARSVSQRGNVEAGVILRFDAEVRLPELLPALVAYHLDHVEAEERPSIERGVDDSTFVQEAVHDAALRTLTIHWSAHREPPLGAWEIAYCGEALGRAAELPREPTRFESFDLAAASAEVILRTPRGEWPIPIRVVDLAALPVNPEIATLGLRELLAILGRRVGTEQLATIRRTRGAEGLGHALTSVFGEGLSPTGVFKAWWGIAEDLSRATTTAAFRSKLYGPLGAERVWQKLREQSPNDLSSDEIWVYGSELARELRAVLIAQGPDRADKTKLRNRFVRELGEQLAPLAPSSTQHAWADEAVKFYQPGGRSAGR
ncbi:MAG: hypothetical protein JNK05_30640 [Myxococcales bacterium]|nr:hypothetical protein [Myxococcales bacterium]